MSALPSEVCNTRRASVTCDNDPDIVHIAYSGAFTWCMIMLVAYPEHTPTARVADQPATCLRCIAKEAGRHSVW